jgi:transposase-like protein
MKVCPHCSRPSVRVGTSKVVDGVRVRYYVCDGCGGTSKSTTQEPIESDLTPILGTGDRKEDCDEDVEPTT